MRLLPKVRARLGRTHIAALWLMLLAISARAELPLARLTTIFPPGGQRGGKFEVMLTGQDLDGVNRLIFSRAGIVAVPIPSSANSGPKFLVSVDPSVSPGLYDVRAAGLFGVTNPRTFEVCRCSAGIAASSNTRADAPMDVAFGSAIYGIAQTNADQFYRVRVAGRKRLIVDVAATSLDSRMEPVVIVSEEDGRELGRSRRAGEPIEIDSPADGRCLISIHDVLYRGGTEFFYSMHISDNVPVAPRAGSLRWPMPPAAAFLDDSMLSQMRSPRSCDPSRQSAAVERHVQPPCDIAGEFRTARQRDSYTFDAAAGTVYAIEIVSHRLGQDTSPFFLLQRVERDAKGAEKRVDLQEVYAPAPPASVVEFPLGTRDPIYRLEVKEAGTYRLLVRDLFARDRGEHPAAYHLLIRRQTPDFELVVMPMSPLPDPADSKDVPVWTTLLLRGGTAPITVIAGRRDGFAGPIALHVEGLPPEVTADPAILPEGATTATIVLRASETARQWVGPITLVGVAQTATGEIHRVARPATVSFSEYNAEKKALLLLRSRLSDQLMIAVSSVEADPISITPAQDKFEAMAGGKVSVAFDVKRRAEFTSPIVLNLAGYPPATQQWAVDPKGEKAAVELDLAKLKLPPGQYTFHFFGQAKLKYPDSPDLRAARITQMSAETREDEMSAQVKFSFSDMRAAVQARDMKHLMNRVRAFLDTEMNWTKAARLLTIAEARSTEITAHAPVAERTISIYSGAFELNVLPAKGK